jgi:signal transduction histidine kinase
MFQSAVLKLTLWYLFIIMMISLCFSLALFSATSHDFEQNLRQQGQHFMRFGVSPYEFEQARQRALAELKHREIINLVRFNLVVLIVAGGASHFLARRTLRPLEQAMEAQSRFTGDASHELRTPLTAMRTEIEVALREPRLKPADARNLLISNLEEVVKLETLSQALLQLARFSAESGAIEMMELDLADPVKAAVERLEKNARAKKIVVEVKLKHIMLKGNEASLTELFATLVDNAIKYGRAKGKVSIAIKSTGKDAVVEIQDDGIGIKADDIDHIFDRFYRADTSRTKNTIDGYGLGLSLAAQIAHVHHGAISVRSVEGEGSTFTVHLPLGGHTQLTSLPSQVATRTKNFIHPRTD